MKLPFYSIFVFFIFFLVSCSSINAYNANNKLSGTSLKMPRAQNRGMGNGDSLHLNYKKHHFKFWVNYFSKREVARFKRHLKNGVKYKDIIQAILREHGLPEDLYYVGLIESGYNLKIKSRASAVGPWQFIKGTGKRYGLKINSLVDERHSIIKATHAAAGYFKDLYNIFGSWDLALCAYNAGEYRIINAIRRGNTRNYQELVRKRLLPKETIYYLPKVAAAKHLAESPRFRMKKRKSEFKNLKFVLLRKNFNLVSLGRKIRVHHSILRKLNPDIKRSRVRVGRKGFKILVPASARLGGLQRLKSSLGGEKRVAKRSFYRVRRGENLSVIAKKLRVSVSSLKRLNGIRGNYLPVGKRLSVPRVNARSQFYTVRSGDNLSKIARNFGTTISTIIAKNNLKSRTIFPRQRLLIPDNS